jgi:hypothetical protein
VAEETGEEGEGLMIFGVIKDSTFQSISMSTLRSLTNSYKLVS